MKENYKNIVISGDVGTGTSTLAKGLAKKLKWKYLTAGDIFRAYHKEHNIPLWNKMALPDDFDKRIDQEFYEEMRVGKNNVLESHYGAWFARNLNDVFRILLVADKKVTTKRILDREHTHRETPSEIEIRRKQLKSKFKKLYSKENYDDPKLFHLVLDTTKVGEKETMKLALNNFLKANLKKGDQ